MKKLTLTAVLLLTSLAQSQNSVESPNILHLDLQKVAANAKADHVLAHLETLQEIATANNGTRAAGTSGYDLSSHYITTQLISAGYDVRLQPFSFDQFKKLSPSEFSQTLPEAKVYEEEKDFHTMDYSPSGGVAAVIQPVDLSLGLGNQSTSGCEIEDFAGFAQGSIALIQRGTCPFAQKAENAAKAGASGVIIFNQGDQETRKELFGGTLGKNDLGIPVFSISYDLGVSFAQTPGLSLSMTAQTQVETKITHNVIAETATGDDGNVVMIGAHLDSVEDGPGINDNGSGSASILEVALSMKDITPVNKVRFAWWGAEEHGLVGSRHYAATLTEEEVSRIALYLNFDMVGSVNYVFGIYDGDGSTFNEPGPKGSVAIEKLFHDFFAINGLETVDVPSNGRSDYVGFAERGIPFGGSFTGAEGEKSKEEADKFGGAAGEAYDSCYHKACDTMANISRDAIEANLQMITFATLSYARSTADVAAEKQADESTPTMSLSDVSATAKPKIYPRYFKHKRIPVWAE